MSTDCPFCDRIKAGEYGLSNDFAVSFEPLNPVTPGHLLIVPRNHASTAGEDPRGAGDAMHLAASIAALAGDEAAYNIITSAGSAATQTIRHTHLHLVPRRPGDGLHLPWTGQQPAPGGPR